MHCIICGAGMEYYFSKHFGVLDLKDVDYWRCPNCGFCASKTHFCMNTTEWASLNTAFHAQSHNRRDNPYNRNQRYFRQALMLSLMNKQELVNSGKWIDWGAGNGQVARLLKTCFDIEMMAYDQYFTPNINPISCEMLKKREYNLVLNTAVFEHVRNRQTLDEIESYVHTSGVFAIHTLVPETIPKDPDWMYLLPVHCAFHTNRSMQLLMEQWGYECSVYNEKAKMWVLFREYSDSLKAGVERLNELLGWKYLHFKKGFMDYWK